MRNPHDLRESCEILSDGDELLDDTMIKAPANISNGRCLTLAPHSETFLFASIVSTLSLNLGRACESGSPATQIVPLWAELFVPKSVHW